jgi:Zn-dependent M28 family amino/carboxypeptidase
MNMRHSLAPLSALLFVTLASACAGRDNRASIEPALNAITAEGLLAHTRVLASDAFEGRGPGTPGEDSTVAYLTRQFQALGLKPGNPDGTFVQGVDMVGFTASPTASVSAGGRTISLKFPDDYVAVSRHERPETRVANSDIVFVGYGVVAPEYGWDDYKSVDVKGKTIVMLVNDPPVADSRDSTQLDTAMFRGKAMTYYGRWTYKYEIASERGAAAAIIVHETGPAGYPYEVVRASWGRENFDIASGNGAADSGATGGRVPVEAWITLDKARELFSAGGQNFDALHEKARHKDFQPVSLTAKADFVVKNTTRRIQSRNVVAKLEGSDATQRDEYVIYTAHWDHFGRDSSLQGDQIFNGALDNASGTAAVLEIAKAFTSLPEPPRRSILFLAVTGEERGLLGAKYYAQHPLYPLEKTLADINIDGINQWGRTSDIVVIGLGNSTLDDELAAVAQATGRKIIPDAEPEKGFFYRSDHFEFAKEGVPALYTDSGIEFVGKPADYGTKKRDEYTNNDYHKPTDEVKPDWDLTGGVADTQLLFQVGYRVAQGSRWPEWKPGTEFKAKRDSMLKKE